ncbi:MAG: hypothetical protein ACFCD0_12375 [Gemmataceae bacterium]
METFQCPSCHVPLSNKERQHGYCSSCGEDLPATLQSIPSPDARSSSERRRGEDEDDWERDDRRSDERYDRRDRHRPEDRDEQRSGWERRRSHDDDYDDYDNFYYDDPYPRRTRRRLRQEREDSSAWQTVHSGLVVGICGMVPLGIILVMWFLFYVLSLAGNDIFPVEIEWAAYSVCGTICGTVLSLIVMFIGRCLCCSIPKETQGQAFGIAAMVFFITPFLPLNFIFFGLWMKKIGEYLHDHRLTQQAYIFSLVWCFLCGGLLLVGIGLGIWNQQNQGAAEFPELIGRFLTVGFWSIFLGLWIWQIILSWWTSRLVTQATASPQVLSRDIY